MKKKIWNIFNIIVGCFFIFIQSQFTFPILAEVLNLTTESLGFEILAAILIAIIAVPYCVVYFIIIIFFKSPKLENIKISFTLLSLYLILTTIFFICATVR